MNTIRTLRILSAALMASAMASCSSVNSVVPKDQASLAGLHKLGVWKQESTSMGSSKTASQAKYNAARNQVNALVTVTLPAKVKQVASQPIGTVDLSEAAIPDSVTKAVVAFEASAQQPGVMGAVPAALIEKAVKALLDWAVAAAKEARQKSADDLIKQLNDLAWADWSTVHK